MDARGRSIVSGLSFVSFSLFSFIAGETGFLHFTRDRLFVSRERDFGDWIALGVRTEE